MEINADFDQRVVVHSHAMKWAPSPIPGVDRRPLDRVGDEVARATSIVRYAPGSKFSPHVHTGGEEFLVLSGVFQDEHGDFPAGSYIRNPPKSRHQPGSQQGCIIFVKLWQFHPDDPIHVQLNTNFMEAIPTADSPGIAVTPLYIDAFETVELQSWQPDIEKVQEFERGAEILVLQGNLIDQADKLEPHSWLRIPIGGKLNAKAGSKGVNFWLKKGHLNNVQKQIQRVSLAQKN